MAALGSEDWCDAIHAGVFSVTADRQCTELPLLRLPRLVFLQWRRARCGTRPARPLVNPPARVARGAGPDADQEDLLCAPRVAPVLLRNVHEP